MRLFLFLILLNLCFYSCKKYDAALTAFYLKPSKASVTSNLSQGSNSSKITDLWVYTNGQFQGAFPYNHLIPIVNNNKSAKIYQNHFNHLLFQLKLKHPRLFDKSISFLMSSLVLVSSELN